MGRQRAEFDSKLRLLEPPHPLFGSHYRSSGVIRCRPSGRCAKWPKAWDRTCSPPRHPGIDRTTSGLWDPFFFLQMVVPATSGRWRNCDTGFVGSRATPQSWGNLAKDRGEGHILPSVDGALHDRPLVMALANLSKPLLPPPVESAFSRPPQSPHWAHARLAVPCLNAWVRAFVRWA